MGQTADKGSSEHEELPPDNPNIPAHRHEDGAAANDSILAEEEDGDGESVNDLPMVIRQISAGRRDSPLLAGIIPVGGEDGEGHTISSVSLQKDNIMELTTTSQLIGMVTSSSLVDNPDRFVQLEFTIKKSRPHAGLGITIVASQKPIPGLHQIRRILPGGIAARDNRLRPGDRLVSVNGVMLLNLKSADVQRILSKAPKDCHLLICRDLDFEFDVSSSVTSLGSVSGSRSSIFSSEDESLSLSPTKRFSDSYDLSSYHIGAVNPTRSVSHQNKRWSTGVLHEPSPLLHVAASSNLQNLSTELGTSGDHRISHHSVTSGSPSSSLSCDVEHLKPAHVTHINVAERGTGENQTISELQISTPEDVLNTQKSSAPPHLHPAHTSNFNGKIAVAEEEGKGRKCKWGKPFNTFLVYSPTYQSLPW